MAVSVSTHTLEQISQDIATNSSVVRYLVKIKTSGASHNDNNITTTYHIDGTTYTKTHKLPSNTTTTVVDKTVTITHNSDGTRVVNADFSTPTQISAGTITGSKSLTLTAIPRASDFGVANANIGSSTTITINKLSDSFTTTLWYKASGQNDWTKIVDKTNLQSYAWTVPTSFYALIPNNPTINCEFKAETYNGDTLVGTTYASATFNATGNPTINSITAIDTNNVSISLTGDSSKMIKYGSIVKVTVSATAQNSSSISSITINGITANNNGEVEFRWTDTNVFNVVVTDSRGNYSTNAITMPMVDYSLITLNANVSRNTPTDGKVNIQCSGIFWDDNFGVQNNTLTLEYRIKESGGSWTNWRTLTPTITDNTYSLTYQEDDFNYRKQYEMEIRAVDQITERSITGIVIPKGEPVYWWNEDTFYVNGYIDSKQTNNYYGIAYSDIDANNLIDNGVYYLGTGCSNIPVSAYFYLVVLRAGYTNSSDMVQFGFDYNCNLYIRFRNGTTWGNWIQK